MQNLLINHETERLSFRKLDETDFPLWLEFFKDPSSTRFWYTGTDDPETNCRQWFDKTFYRYTRNKGGMNVLIDKATGAFVGQCGLLVQTVDGKEELEIGYSLMPAWRGNGYATEAALACRQHAFENNLCTSLISIIAVDNLESQQVAIRNGMHLEKTTTYSDNLVHIYRVRK